MRAIEMARLIHVKPAAARRVDLRQKAVSANGHSSIHEPVHVNGTSESAVEENNSGSGSRQAAGRLNAFLRASAQELFGRILTAECERYVQGFGDAHDERGRDAVVRNGYQPRREIETGIGPVSVRVPKVRSRTGRQAVFHSCIVPRYLRRARMTAREADWRFLYGLWCCDLNQVLVALLGTRGSHLACVVPESVRSEWVKDCARLRSKPVGEHGLIEVWAECITPDPLWMAAPGSMLAVVGTDAKGSLQLLALDHGLADTRSRWTGVVENLLSRGLRMPERINASGAANGFSKALGTCVPARTPELTGSVA